MPIPRGIIGRAEARELGVGLMASGRLVERRPRRKRWEKLGATREKTREGHMG